jgi:hypothetical protein
MEIYNGKYCVYVHTNKINGKMYVGQTCQKPEYRWSNGTGYVGSTYFYRAIQKYGWGNFEHEVVASNLTKVEANNFEKLLIQMLNTTDENSGYNLTNGGDGMTGFRHSPETKEKMRQNNLGANNNNYGKHLDEDQKRKISESNSGVKNYNAHAVFQYDLQGNFIQKWDYIRQAAKALNISASNISGCCSHQQRMAGGFIWMYADDILGQTNIHPYRHYHTQEIIQYDPQGNEIRRWFDAKEAANVLKLHRSTITKACVGKLKTAGGFIWRYIDNPMEK